MVIIVEFFTTNNDAPGRYVGAGIGTGKVAIPDCMAQAVNHTCCPEWDPCHLNCPYSQAKNAKQRDVNSQHDQNTEQAVARVHVAFHPVVGRTVTETLEGFFVFTFETVEFGAPEEHHAQAKYDRRMGIAFTFASCMMFAMD